MRNTETITLHISLYLILFFLISFVLLLGMYLYLTLKEIVLILNNYNYKRAKLCNWKHCGFYDHNEKSPKYKACFQPFVPVSKFERLSKGGTEKGCSLSIAVEKEMRKSAEEYRNDFQQKYNTFHFSKPSFKLISIFVGLLFWLLGILSLPELINLVFQ